MLLALLDSAVHWVVRFVKGSQLWALGLEILERSLGRACFLCWHVICPHFQCDWFILDLLRGLLTSAASFSQKLKLLSGPFSTVAGTSVLKRSIYNDFIPRAATLGDTVDHWEAGPGGRSCGH